MLKSLSISLIAKYPRKIAHSIKETAGLSNRTYCYFIIAIAIYIGIQWTLENPLPVAIAQSQILEIPDADMKQILWSLKNYHFTVLFQRPPVAQAYGLMQSSTKTIWIHPATFPLGIAKQTLIHESVHAAQSCRSQESLRPLGLSIPMSPLARPHFLPYHHYRRHVEAEALTVQGLPNGVDYILKLLEQNCSKSN